MVETQCLGNKQSYTDYDSFRRSETIVIRVGLGCHGSSPGTHACYNTFTPVVVQIPLNKPIQKTKLQPSKTGSKKNKPRKYITTINGCFICSKCLSVMLPCNTTIRNS